MRRDILVPRAWARDGSGGAGFWVCMLSRSFGSRRADVTELGEEVGEAACDRAAVEGLLPIVMDVV